jgi:hypothetical protein
MDDNPGCSSAPSEGIPFEDPKPFIPVRLLSICHRPVSIIEQVRAQPDLSRGHYSDHGRAPGAIEMLSAFAPGPECPGGLVLSVVQPSTPCT